MIISVTAPFPSFSLSPYFLVCFPFFPLWGSSYYCASYYYLLFLCHYLLFFFHFAI